MNRFPVNKLLTETEAWLRKVLPTYMPTDATPAITAILQVCTDYVKSVKLHFREVENHVSTGNAADVTNFMSKYLGMYFERNLVQVNSFLTMGRMMYKDWKLRLKHFVCTYIISCTVTVNEMFLWNPLLIKTYLGTLFEVDCPSCIAVVFYEFMNIIAVPHQLKYLQSVFEFLNTGDTSNVMKMEEMGNPRQSNRCTGFNGRCEWDSHQG